MLPLPDDIATLEKRYLDGTTRGRPNSEVDNAALNAGRRIREGDRSKGTLQEIVAWKNSNSRFWEKLRRDFDKNKEESVADALEQAVNGASGSEALFALTKLSGIAVPTASAILATIFPERYTIIDQLALRAIGVWNKDIAFYLLYNSFCCSQAAANKVELRTLDRALWMWGRGKRSPPEPTAASTGELDHATREARRRPERTGVPLLPMQRPDATVTLDIVNALRDSTDKPL